MTRSATVAALVAANPPEAPVLGAPGRPTLTYGGLRRQIEGTVAALNGFGIGRNDRVAIVLPNGPEMAAAFLCVAGGAVTAPLNPDYREEEFAFYLEDLRARALLVRAGEAGPAVAAAEGLGIPILRLEADMAGPAGGFRMEAEGGVGSGTAAPGEASADDTALILHTSGTTSRPKIVPLRQSNVTASAAHIAATLALGPGDRAVNIMPLFHIHGLIAALLATVRAGASVHCSPGFDAFKVFDWFAEASPTWYTAVPTMHQAVLARAPRNGAVVEAMRLRFIRSSSSSLAPQVMRNLERVFGCPVVESYGMTEASHQMTSNLLPPGERRPGSVGPAAGPEVRIMGEAGRLLEPGHIGEVVIRGPNVASGYENNPAANAEAFTDGWFRTGDQGVMDADGYLMITGRLKEIINRGGEKISPREVDEVLLDHDAVGQVVTFAMPHGSLGEEVAAAVVLAEGREVGERELRNFAAARLAAFKVPRRILFLDEIPKGATGKLQRIGLAGKLGLAP